MAANTAISSGDLVDLVSSSGTTTIYPNDDAILSVLQARFRADLPYTRIGASSLVVVNPYKTLASVNDVSAREYEERSYRDTSLPMADSPRPLQPHVYDLAARMYLMMRRRNESQALVSRGITGSGKTSTQKLLLIQLLRLSTYSKKDARLAEQIKALSPVLSAFGNAKTLMNPNATRHVQYTELHFSNEDKGQIVGAKVVSFGLDKSRLARLAHEERSFHVFYQLLAGATPQERDALGLEDASDYALLASSGCYRLPSGPFSDDSIGMDELRGCMRTLGFKAKHIASIFDLLATILLLGNIQFSDGDSHTVSAFVVNPPVLEQAARRLGISAEDLTQVLTNKTSYVRKELYTVLLNAEQSSAQRDRFVKDLYSILFAYVVETANMRIAPPPASEDPESPSPPTSQIVILDHAGYQTRGAAGTSSMALYGQQPLISAHGNNGFEEFCINFTDELVHSYTIRHVFEDNVGFSAQMTADGVSLPSVAIMDNSACVELLRGGQLSERALRKPGGVLGVLNKAASAYKSGKGGERRDEDMLQEMVAKFGVHASFVASPASSRVGSFGINHYAGPCTYDVKDFVERDTDLVDAAFVSLLRASASPFLGRLFSGPSFAVEHHAVDQNTIVQAQVSSRPLRPPTPIAFPDGSVNPESEELIPLDPNRTYPVTIQTNCVLSSLLSNLDSAKLWSLSCIRPNDSTSPNSFDKRRVKSQIRALLLPDFVSRRSATGDMVVGCTFAEFCERYVPTMRGSEEERITQCARSNGWREGGDYVIGGGRVWLGYGAWKIAEDGLRGGEGVEDKEGSVFAGEGEGNSHLYAPESRYGGFDESADNLLAAQRGTSAYGPGGGAAGNSPYGGGGLSTPGAQSSFADEQSRGGNGVGAWGSEYASKEGGIEGKGEEPNDGFVTKETAPSTAVEEIPSSRSRRFWVGTTWALTFYIPNFLLQHVGRMKRPDIRMAWREKLAICLLIFLFNGLVIFWIVGLPRVLCPDYDKAWNFREVATHQGENDWYATVQGKVYDFTKFVGRDHSSQFTNIASNTEDILETLAGQDLTNYFPPPLTIACPDLVADSSLVLMNKNFTAQPGTAVHTSGPRSQAQTSGLRDIDWYRDTFQPKIKDYVKGPLVWSWKDIQEQANEDGVEKIWAVFDRNLYDLTDYFWTISQNTASIDQYGFLDDKITDLFQEQKGRDITKDIEKAREGMSNQDWQRNYACLNNMFYVGTLDFREESRCTAAPILLVVFAAIIMGAMGIKFLAALQLGGKSHPELQDKFVLCQVPCYTEGEDSLRRTIDSLAALNYDDKRKLIFIICDGNIIGSGNDRTTPRITLDILGVDPKLDPEPLLFKSVGEGSKALNYGKVYSGLYEFEGHVVPYMVIVKVGKPTERSKPGNRGKRDSQILVMHYLNRVHFDAPMSPLELEIYHQMRNVIGIDPAFYEYIFTIDADTTVTPESLNRLVAASADDQRIIGICGETKLLNPEESWWTMIQVYEYYLSHHMSKAFESLFGSVTCLPGCFTLYRIRTADKGRPIIISSRVIDEYSEPNVDTLHKKNLFSLGEDRFLTTLLMKHFPTFKTKFRGDAIAHTVAPDSWRILFSQRRRWINSTIHNLCELVLLPELFGFCCFSMRFFVFLDLLSTLILPATVIYLVYLIVTVATGNGPLPQLAIIMIAFVYGLQAIIFILKREFMLIGWMVVYILSYPVYSFFLPIYSFWCMDEFGWGNTRLVIGEGKDKKVVVSDDDKFDESMIPLKKFSEYEAEAWENGSNKHSDETGYHQAATVRSARGPGSIAKDGSPRSYTQASQSGDYFRDTNAMSQKMGPMSHPNHSQSNLSHHGEMGMPMQPAQHMPYQLPFMPFAGGPGSAAGSDYGGGGQMQMQPGMMGPMGYQHSGPMGYQNTGSMYGMPQMGPMGPMMYPTHTGGSFGGSQGGFAPPVMPGAQGGNQASRMSTFSLATTVNLGGPSMSTNPTEEELFTALRNYLSTQDLMSVTKKTAREAIAAKFPKADLSNRKEFLNSSIDQILSSQ